MKLFISCSALFLSLFGFVFANETTQASLDRYFEYLDRYEKAIGPLGDAEKGEIEILRDINKIQEIQKSTGRQVGIVAEDNYWIWINDAVKFSNGKYGVYGRVLWRKSLTGMPGIAVMPILPNGKIALNRNYRHATRSWEYELPRGGVEGNETHEEAAKREVKEETGMIIDKLFLLGMMAPDTGLTNTIVPIYLAKVAQQGSSQPEDSEAIAAIEAFTIEEIKTGYLHGFLLTEIDGKECKVYLRDPFLSFALFQIALRKEISSP